MNSMANSQIDIKRLSFPNADAQLLLGLKGDKGDTGDKGDKGDTGDTGNGIASITHTGTSGAVKTYTITFTDGTSQTYDVTDGQVTTEQMDTAIDNAVTDVKSELKLQEEETFLLPATYFESGTYNNNFQPVSNSDRIRSIKIPVHKGEEITIVQGQTCDYITYGTFDASGVWSDVTSWLNVKTTIKIEDETYIAFICKSGVAGTTSISPSDFDAQITFKSNTSIRADEMESDFSDLSEAFGKSLDLYDVPLGSIDWFWNRGYISDRKNINFGVDSTSLILKGTDYILIPDGCIAIKCKMPIYENPTSFGLIFYDENKLPIKGYAYNTGVSYSSEMREFLIPKYAKYYRTGWFKDEDTYGSFEAYHYYSAIVDTGEIEDATFPNTGKGVVAVSSIVDFGGLSNSSILDATGYIPVGYCSCIVANLPHYESTTTFGFVFYDKDKNPLIGYTFNARGSYGIETRKFNVPTNAYFFRTSKFIDEQTYGATSFYRSFDRAVESSEPYIFVCASNSSAKDKVSADYICDGVNDEVEIQAAVNAAKGHVVLAQGDYYIDSFPHSEGYGISSAIHFGAIGQQNIIVSGAEYGSCRKANTSNQLYGGAIIHVSDNCYNNLSDSTQYAIFASISSGSSRNYPWSKVKIENIGFVLPDNQKKIICIDGWMMTSLSINNIHAIAVADASNLKVPVDGCIGIRGLQGSNFGINNRWESSFVWGFYEGYAVSGEHIVGVDLGSRFCNYGFTFNRKTNAVGAWIHPITMINCCDECNFNLPVFGNSGESSKSDGLSGRQTIDLIDYNLEWLSQYSALGGNLATELNAGQTYGSITFTCQPSYGGNSKNDVSAQFWADGYGHNMKTVNMAHAESGTSTERATYYPQYMQKYFDTTLNKLLIYNGSNWVDTMGNLLT